MEVWVALIGLGGVLLGAASQSVFSRFQASRSRRDELLSSSYSAFIDAVSSIAAEARTSEARTSAGWKNLIGAKFRLLYFAPSSVIAALAAFDRTSARLGVPDADLAFAALLKAMRRSLHMKQIEERDLYRIMVGRDTPDLPSS